MKLLSFFVKFFLVLVALALTALVVFVLLFDPNDYRDRVSALVREHTGRELILAGPLELSWFPWLAVEAGNVSLGNASGFGNQPMVSVRSVSAELRILPLLFGEIEVGTVNLAGLDLRLNRDAEGRSNWDDLLVSRGGDAASSSAEPATEARRVRATDRKNTDTAGSEPFQFSLEGLQASDVHVVWEDRAAGTKYVFEDGQLAVGAVRQGAPLDLETEFAFALAEPAMRGRFKLAGRLAFDLAANQFASPRLTLALRAQGASIPGGEAQVSLALEQLRLDLERERASASAFLLQGYKARVSGSFSARDIVSGPSASGVVELQPCDAKAVLHALGVQPPVTSAPDAMTDVSATVRFDYAPHHLRVPFIRLAVDGTILEGRVSAQLNKPEYALALSCPALDLTPYLPPLEPAQEGREPSLSTEPAGTGKDSVTAEDAASEESAEPEWVQLARGLSLDLHVALDDLRARNIRLRGLDLTARGHHGVVAVEPLDVRIEHDNDLFTLQLGKGFADMHAMRARWDSIALHTPGGGISGSVRATNLTTQPEINADLALEHLNLRTLAELAGDLMPVSLPETSDQEVLTDWHGALTLGYSPAGIRLEDMDLLLDDTTVLGRADVDWEQERYDAQLRLGKLDLDRYLPAKQSNHAGETAPESVMDRKPDDTGTAVTKAGQTGDVGRESSNARKELLERLRRMRADVRLEAEALQYDGLTLSDIHTGLGVQGGVVRLEPFALDVEQGHVDMIWEMDAAGQVQHQCIPTIKGVRLGRLLKRYAGIDQAGGTLSVRTIEPLTWEGLDVEPLKRTLSGSLGFGVRDGEYPGLDLFAMLAVVDSLTKAVLEGEEDESTKFGEITGTLVADQGRIHCDDLCVKAPGLRAGGEGFVNLPDNRIEYLVRAMAVQDASGQGGAGCDEFYGVPMPLRVSGTLDNPRYWVSAEEYAASIARGAVGLVTGVVGGILDGGGQVGDVIEGGAQSVQGAVESIVDGVVDGADQGATEGSDAVGGAVDQGREAVEDFIDGLEGLF
ncbi:AsmA family protein [Paucidesulfovibrio gracilis DSM 16080]|uniref:AsmA family protein n=1 Tax=Paucidesulfovibrio gracilis DSM 16080 TaxID=1121449 RepID=A0A1T4W148_9BACT|nr:AsmA family protein [Paucidesulfovibrio gracilis]SKA70970.1 AsmA family protein [Paucidesulfovibrio gracilis DSM 16080]